MKVRTLIKFLQKVPQNADVVFPDLGTDQGFVVEVRRCEYTKEYNTVKLDYK